MNEIVHKFLLAGDKFMFEMRLGNQELLTVLVSHLRKTKRECKLDKTYFQHDMAYGDFKDLPRRTASDKLFFDKAFNITKNPKYDGYQGAKIVTETW